MCCVSIISSLDSLSYHRIEFRFTPTENSCLKYWCGSVIRNNLLYAAEQVKVTENKTLFSVINELSLEDSHPLYKELSGGFPKGYTLSNIQFNESLEYPIQLMKNSVYKFSVCLIGKMATYHPYLIEAVRIMCQRGIGSPLTPLILVEASEIHPCHPPHLLYTSGIDTIPPLSLPILPADFSTHGESIKAEVKLHLLTPLHLVQNRKKKNQEISFQDKQNGFPSFYQFTRSVIYRLIKYMALYGQSNHTLFSEEYQKNIDNFILQAALPTLTSVNLKRTAIRSTPKKKDENHIVLRGYIGEMSYYGSFGDFLPLLLFAQELGAGNDVTYGLGQYKIEITE